MRERRFDARAESKDYGATCLAYANALRPAVEVPEGTPLFLVANHKVDHEFFTLREADRQPLAGLDVGGKSSHVAFTDTVREAVFVLFDRAPRDTDVLLVLPEAKLLHSAGYRAFHAPTQSFWLHLRLVQEDMLAGKMDDACESARRSLARLFKHNARRVKTA
jgi:hypothetical protein